MTSDIPLATLQFNYQNRSLEDNFKTLKHLLSLCPKNSICLAPELCLSGYAYESMEASSEFSKKTLPILCELSHERSFGLSLITKETRGYENSFCFFHKGELIHKRAKARLFPLGEEEKHFQEGFDEQIKILHVDGIKIAILVCFEIRFSELWQRVLGADIILVPALWGASRKEHLKVLSQALAIANQAFVLVSNSSDDDMASSSGIITPFGNVYRDDGSFLIQHKASAKELEKMRRYIQIGL